MTTVQERVSRPSTVLLVVSVAAFLASLDLFIVNIAFPDIRLAFPSDDLATMSWILNGYTVVFAACLAPAGRLADRYGRRRLFLIGVAVFTVASGACALAGSIPVLVAFRVAQAVGAALIMPTSLALLLAAYPAARRSMAVGAWSAIGAMAAALGPPLGGLLVEASWRWVFLVNLPIGLLALLFGPRVLKESRDTSSGVPDLLGAAGLLIGVGAVAFALVEAPDHGWTSTEVLVGFAVAVVALVWVPLRSARHPVPVLDLRSMRVPTMWLSCLAIGVFAAGFAAMLFGNVLFLTGIWHESVLVAGLSLAPGPLAVVAVSVTGGKLAHRFGPGPVVALGGLSFALGAGYWLWRMGAEQHYAADMLPGQMLTGIGVGLALPSLSGVVATVLPPDRWGAGSSLINTSRQVGTVLGTAVLILVYGGTQDLTAFRHGWIFIVATMLATALAGVLIATRRRSADTEHSRPPADNAAEPDPIRLTPVEAALVELAPVRAPALLGTARDSDGTPLPATTITIVGPTGHQLDRTSTDDDGRFALAGPLPGRVMLIASRAGHQPLALDLAGEEAVDLVLPFRGGIGGVVRDHAGNPVGAATVVLTDLDGRVLRSGHTSTEGRFLLDGLRHGERVLTAAVAPAHVHTRRVVVPAEGVTQHDVVLVAEPALPAAT